MATADWILCRVGRGDGTKKKSETLDYFMFERVGETRHYQWERPGEKRTNHASKGTQVGDQKGEVSSRSLREMKKAWPLDIKEKRRSQSKPVP